MASLKESPEDATQPTANRKACDACRRQKTRCFPDPGGDSPDCQRCIRSSRACVFSAQQRRKQRKRVDTRIGALEAELKALKSLLQSSQATGSHQSTESPELGKKSLPDSDWCSENSKRLESQDTSLSSAANPRKVDAFSSDFVGRGLVPMAAATALFWSYVHELAPYYPVVIFDPALSATDLRRTKPVLFLAVITAAASKIDTDIYALLSKEIMQTLATRVFINGEKSLELVQASIVTSIWYDIPEGAGNLKFYQHIHMAATMAMDLGIGSKVNSNVPLSTLFLASVSNGKPTPPKGSPVLSSADASEIECRRTILGCFILCSGCVLPYSIHKSSC